MGRWLLFVILPGRGQAACSSSSLAWEFSRHLPLLRRSNLIEGVAGQPSKRIRQQELAKALGISFQQVQNYETGAKGMSAVVPF